MIKKALTILPLCLAILGLACLLLSGLGYQLQWWPLDTAFLVFRWAAYFGAAAVVLGMLSALLDVRQWPSKTLAIALISIIVGGFAFMTPFQWLKQVRSVPMIHDITTDLVDPPEFVAIIPLRANAPNPAAYDTEAREKQREAYPDITTLAVSRPLSAVFAAAVQVVDELGMELVASDESDGRIEATATTKWFRFKDDVVMRIRESNGNTEVDIRSKSRIGKSDLGVNAERIRQLQQALLARLGAG